MAKGETIERDYRKPCTLCSKLRDVLVRCQIDETGTWHFVCPGSCWKKVSGGVIDGDHDTEHEHYRYGGMVSAASATVLLTIWLDNVCSGKINMMP